MLRLLLWLILFVLCWPLALAALVFYPLIWLLLLPLRLFGVVVEGVFELLRAVTHVARKTIARQAVSSCTKAKMVLPDLLLLTE